MRITGKKSGADDTYGVLTVRPKAAETMEARVATRVTDFIVVSERVREVSLGVLTSKVVVEKMKG